MPIQEDIKALDWATQNPDDPRATKITQKLGVGTRDLEAWQYAKSNANDPRSTQIAQKLVYKIGKVNASPTEAESLIRGGIQGFTLGTGDEIYGAGRALVGKVMGEGDIGDLYSKYRDESRMANDAAKEANPKTYLAGKVGGAVGLSAVVPGMGLATGAPAAANIGRAGLLGMIDAAGETKSSPLTDIRGFNKDVGIGTGTAMLTQGAMQGGKSILTPQAMEKVGSFAEKAAKKGGAVSDFLVGAGGTLIGAKYGSDLTAAASGALALGMKKAAKQYGTKVLASGANKAAEILNKDPGTLRQFSGTLYGALQQGPAALAATHAALMEKPEYRTILEEYAAK